jgi:hypothetical protein
MYQRFHILQLHLIVLQIKFWNTYKENDMVVTKNNEKK